MAYKVSLPILNKFSASNMASGAKDMGKDLTKSALRQALQVSGVSMALGTVSPIFKLIEPLIPTIEKIEKEQDTRTKETNRGIAEILEPMSSAQENLELLVGLTKEHMEITSNGLALVAKKIEDLTFITQGMATNAAKMRLERERRAQMKLEEDLEAADAAEPLNAPKTIEPENNTKFLEDLVGGAVLKEFILDMFGKGIVGAFKSLVAIIISPITITLALVKGLGKLLMQTAIGTVAIVGKGIKAAFTGLIGLIGGSVSALLKGIMKRQYLLGAAFAAFDTFNAVKDADKLKDEFGTKNRGTAVIGKSLGGDSEGGLLNAGEQAMKWGGMGAAIGSIIPGVGTAIGGIIGVFLGALSGYFGGEKIAQLLDTGWENFKEYLITSWDSLVKGVKDFGEWIGKIPERIMGYVTDKWEGIKEEAGNILSPVLQFFKDMYQLFDDTMTGLQKFVYDTLVDLGPIGESVANKIFSNASIAKFKKIDTEKQPVTNNMVGNAVSSLKDFAMLDKGEKTAVLMRNGEALATEAKKMFAAINQVNAPVVNNNITNVSNGSTSIVMPKPTRNSDPSLLSVPLR